jgi:hypothetical protein
VCVLGRATAAAIACAAAAIAASTLAAQVQYDGAAVTGSTAEAAAELDLLARQGRPAASLLLSPLERAERRVAGHPTRLAALAASLDARAAEGYRLVAVARPEFPFVPRHVVALLARAPGEARAIYEKGVRASYDVVTEPLLDRPTGEAVARSDRPDVEALRRRLDRAGREGFQAFRATYRLEAPGRERLEVFLTRPAVP